MSAKIEAGGYDAIICYSVQDGVSVAAAFIAKALGIAFLSPKAFGFQAATCLFDDPRNMAPCFRDAFAVAIANPTPHESLMRRGHEALATFRARPAPPDYMVVANGSVSQKPGLLDSAALIWRFLSRRKPENLRYPLPLSRLVFDWRRALMAQRAAKSPLFQPRGALGGKKYIYFPLHYEPEASLLVSSPDETDQIAVLKRLTEALPQGWVIGAKEHRPMLGRRPSGYYERLAAMANIVLISPFEDSFALTQGAALTATITGTAGLESVLLGRPTLFFGDHPIQIIGAGFYRARAEKCAEAVASACATPPASDAQLAAFLGALLTESIQVSAQEIWGGLETISFSRVEHQHQALETMAQLLLNAINRAQKPL